MALMRWLRRLTHRQTSASTVGTRRPSSAPRRGDTIHEDALRAKLADDPNDIRSFRALADIVRRNAAECHSEVDPLREAEDPQTAAEVREQDADLAVWALAEEIAGNPRGWYPLVELGRLSLKLDPDSAIRRFTTAAERDPEGHALAQSLAILRSEDMAVEALGLGIGHWRVREHIPDVGAHLVRAAVEAGRLHEAKQHLAALDLHPDGKELRILRKVLRREIDDAEQGDGGGTAALVPTAP